MPSLSFPIHDCHIVPLRNPTFPYAPYLDCQTDTLHAPPIRYAPYQDCHSVPCHTRAIRSGPRPSLPNTTKTAKSYRYHPNQNVAHLITPCRSRPIRDCPALPNLYATSPDVPHLAMSRAFFIREPYTTRALWIQPRRCNRQHALTFQDCPAGTCLTSHRQNVPNPSLQCRDCQALQRPAEHCRNHP